MKSIMSEYGYVLLAIVSVMAGFWFFTWLIDSYADMEVYFISGMTGVEVSDVIQAKKEVDG